MFSSNKPNNFQPSDRDSDIREDDIQEIKDLYEKLSGRLADLKNRGISLEREVRILVDKEKMKNILEHIVSLQ